jgi:hypothetical protein
MVTHLWIGYATRCGLNEINFCDNASMSIDECDCPQCATLVINDLSKYVSLKDAMQCGLIDTAKPGQHPENKPKYVHDVTIRMPYGSLVAETVKNYISELGISINIAHAYPVDLYNTATSVVVIYNKYGITQQLNVCVVNTSVLECIRKSLLLDGV